MPERRFPPPWFVEDIGGCFVVKASNDRSWPALSGFKAKFPVLENNFPVFAAKIPCSIIQGIASKVPKTSAYLSITNAATGHLL